MDHYCVEHAMPGPCPECAAEQADADRLLLRGVRNGEWLDRQQFAPLRYVVDGLIPEGLVLLVGAPKMGKSWIALDVALAVAGNGTCLGGLRSSDHGPVLHLALEDGDRRLRGRAKALLRDAELPAGWHYLTETPGGAVEAMEAWMRLRPDTRLVVVDVFAKARPKGGGKGANAYDVDYEAMTAFKGMVDAHPGLTVLIVHHVNKAVSGDFVHSVSGTNGIAGAADAVLVLSRNRHEDNGTLDVTGRDIPEDRYALDFLEGWAVAGGDLALARERAEAEAEDREATSGLSADTRRVLDYVTEFGSAKAADVESTLGLSNATAKKYLSRLVDRGLLDRADRGLYVARKA